MLKFWHKLSASPLAGLFRAGRQWRRKPQPYCRNVEIGAALNYFV